MDVRYRKQRKSYKITSSSIGRLDTYKRLLFILCCLMIIFLLWCILIRLDTTKGTRYIKPTVDLQIFDMNGVSFAIQCNSSQFPEKDVKMEVMQSVEIGESTIVYSAYHDADKPNVVKIIALCHKDRVTPYYCQVWYQEKDRGNVTMVVTNAKFWYTNPKWRIYIPCFIICFLPSTRIPYAVSIVSHQNCSSATNLMRIEHVEAKNYTRNFTMCLTALHSNFDNAARLVEWIEFNKILGAEHFVIYNFSSGERVQNVLKHYKRKGQLEIVQWPLENVLRKERLGPKAIVHYYGQASCYNDCLYRSKSQSRYVVVSDLDEFLVPHVEGVKTWIDMFKFLPKEDVFQFRNCFFIASNGTNDLRTQEKATALKYSIRSLLSAKRNAYIYPLPKRSKYIARTATAFCLRPHVQLGGKNCTVPPSVGLLHHYKDRRIPRNIVTDETVLIKYGRDILDSVSKAWRQIENS